MRHDKRRRQQKSINDSRASNDEFLWRIREAIPHSFGYFYEQLMNLAIDIMSLRADRLCAKRDRRVGVFGPYPPHHSYRSDGKEVIIKVAQRVSECGFGAITGLGFFAKNRPEKLHPLSELMPPASYKTIKGFRIPDFIYFHHFPKLTCKAVHHLTTVRGQRNEAAGCFSARIPMLGFAMDPKVTRKRRYCTYLIDCGFYSECMCPDSELCFYPVLKKQTPRYYCPFYDYVDIPWDVKQLFIHQRNRLIATARLDKAIDAVEECITAKPVKRKFQKDF